jgi:hypothetical protein
MTLTPRMESALVWITIGRRPWTDRDRWEAAVGPVIASALHALDLIEDWTHTKDGHAFASPKVTLTTYAALWLGVEVVNLRWVRRDRPEGRNKVETTPGVRSFPDLEWVVDPKSVPSKGPEYMLNEWTGEPLTIMGRLVPIDWRIGKSRAAG